MRNRLVTAMALCALLPASALAQQQTGPQSARLNGGSIAGSVPKQPVAQVYMHPDLGFRVVAPPGATIADKADGRQIAIRSRRGYAVNLQTGASRPDIPLARMSSLLEAKYLGEGKPWSARGTDRAMTVGGMPAHDVMYSGSNTKARVVVARGQVNDYVFIYMAPQDQFVNLSHEFNWILDNFQPSPKDMAKPAPAISTAPEPAPMKPRAAAASATGPTAMARSGASAAFSEPGFGYVIEYPGDWDLSMPAERAAMFSGRQGTPEYAAIIGVQNIQPAGARSGDESVTRALNQLKASLGNAVRDLRVLGDQPWTYQRDGRRLVGRQIAVSYTHGGERFRKLLIAIPRPTGTVAHVWSYTAPEGQFASFQPIAKQMLDSWRILTADVQ